MERKSGEYEHAFTVWKKASREFKLCADDKEPDLAQFGLSEWEGKALKARITREMERTA